MARLSNHFCHGNTKAPSLFIVVGVDVAINNARLFSVHRNATRSSVCATVGPQEYVILLLTVSIVSLRLYSCVSYPECKSHLFCVDMYCHLWSVWLDHIFPHYLTNGTNFRQKLDKHKMCVLISTQLSSVTFLFLRRIRRDIIINGHRALCRLPVILVVF